MKSGKAGEYAALLGAIIAVLIGLAAGVTTIDAGTLSWISVLLVVLGIIVGLTTITEKETTAFLIAAIALIVGAGAFAPLVTGSLSVVGVVLTTIFQNFALLFAPAAAIVALKAIWAMASRK